MKIEMHLHTKYSKDSLMNFWFLYWKLKFSGIDAVAITEHNNIIGALEFKKFCARRKKKIQVIVGDEIFTSQGEIIGLFLQEQIKPGLSAKETIYQIKSQNGIVYIPHPYDRKRRKTVLAETVIEENRNLIDCIEIHNGRNISPLYSLKQKEIASKYGIKPVIGSDAHTWIEVGRNYMEASDVDVSSAEKFHLSLYKWKFHEKKCLKIAHQITKYVKLLKMVRSKDFYELHKIINKRFKISK